MINADDLENWTKGQWGLASNGGDWVSFHRYFGDDREEDGVTYSNHGTSEAVMRSQFRAWSKLHAGRLRTTEERTMADANDKPGRWQAGPPGDPTARRTGRSRAPAPTSSACSRRTS